MEINKPDRSHGCECVYVYVPRSYDDSLVPTKKYRKKTSVLQGHIYGDVCVFGYKIPLNRILLHHFALAFIYWISIEMPCVIFLICEMDFFFPFSIRMMIANSGSNCSHIATILVSLSMYQSVTISYATVSHLLSKPLPTVEFSLFLFIKWWGWGFCHDDFFFFH